MQRAVRNRRDTITKLNLLFCGIISCLLTCFIVGCWTGYGPYTVKAYNPTKCLVEHPSGIYEFDDQWHIPRGRSKDKKINCVDAGNTLNNSDITIDEVVYAFQIPHSDNRSGEWQFSRWITTLNAYLLLDLVFKENKSEALQRSKITYEVRMGYQDKKGTDNNWTSVAETTETRKLHCDLYKNGEVAGYQYGCNLIPFFTLGDVYHHYYLINIRFPNDFVGKTSFNNDIEQIRDIQLILMHQTAIFTRLLTDLKIIFYPFSIGVFLWFYKRLYYRPLLVIEKSCLFLGFSLILLDMPLELLAMDEQFTFMSVYAYIRDTIFFAALINFWIGFFAQFFKVRLEFKAMLYFIIYLSPLNLYSLVFLVELFEKFVQVGNPFFNMWDSVKGFRHRPAFNVFSAAFACCYSLILFLQFHIIFRNAIIEQKIVLRTRGGQLHRGGIRAFRFLLYAVASCVCLSILVYVYFQMEEIVFKLVGQNSAIFRLSSHPCLSGILAAVFGMWNSYTFAFLVLYAPARRYEPREEEEIEMEVVAQR